MGFSGGSVVKNSPSNAGASGDVWSIPGSGRSTGEGPGNPLQYSCLESPMNRGAQRAAVCGVAKSQELLKRLRMHAPCSKGSGVLLSKWIKFHSTF